MTIKKTTCKICNKRFLKSSLKRHNLSQKHLKLLEISNKETTNILDIIPLEMVDIIMGYKEDLDITTKFNKVLREMNNTYYNDWFIDNDGQEFHTIFNVKKKIETCYTIQVQSSNQGTFRNGMIISKKLYKNKTQMLNNTNIQNNMTSSFTKNLPMDTIYKYDIEVVEFYTLNGNYDANSQIKYFKKNYHKL